MRAEKLKHHSGEVSFPGGRFDSVIDKNLEDAALRECWEEIGLPPQCVTIIGHLDDSPTISGYIIRPFIGILSIPTDFQYRLNAEEVGVVFTVPIEFFLQKEHFQEMTLQEFGADVGLLTIPYQDPVSNKKFHIWGATAHLISRYLKTIYGFEVTSPKYRRPSMEEINAGRKKYELEKLVKIRKSKYANP
jgi:8-oxo-dGTP pyrophosphatase MutT (NUDIX family)